MRHYILQFSLYNSSHEYSRYRSNTSFRLLRDRLAAICKNGLKQSPIDIADKVTDIIVFSNSTLISINSTNYTIVNGNSFNIVNNEKFSLNMAGIGNILVIKN